MPQNYETCARSPGLPSSSSFNSRHERLLCGVLLSFILVVWAVFCHKWYTLGPSHAAESQGSSAINLCAGATQPHNTSRPRDESGPDTIPPSNDELRLKIALLEKDLAFYDNKNKFLTQELLKRDSAHKSNQRIYKKAIDEREKAVIAYSNENQFLREELLKQGTAHNSELEIKNKTIEEQRKVLSSHDTQSEILKKQISEIDTGHRAELERKSETIEEQGKKIEQQEKTIEQQEKTIEQQEKTIEQQEKTIEQQEKTIEQQEKTIEQQEKTIEQQEKTIEQQEKTIEQQEKTIEQQEKTIEQQEKTIEQQEKTIEQQEKTIEQQEKTIKEQEKPIKQQKKTIGPAGISAPSVLSGVSTKGGTILGGIFGPLKPGKPESEGEDSAEDSDKECSDDQFSEDQGSDDKGSECESRESCISEDEGSENGENVDDDSDGESPSESDYSTRKQPATIMGSYSVTRASDSGNDSKSSSKSDGSHAATTETAGPQPPTMMDSYSVTPPTKDQDTRNAQDDGGTGSVEPPKTNDDGKTDCENNSEKSIESDPTNEAIAETTRKYPAMTKGDCSLTLTDVHPKIPNEDLAPQQQRDHQVSKELVLASFARPFRFGFLRHLLRQSASSKIDEWLENSGPEPAPDRSFETSYHEAEEASLSALRPIEFPYEPIHTNFSEIFHKVQENGLFDFSYRNSKSLFTMTRGLSGRVNIFASPAFAPFIPKSTTKLPSSTRTPELQHRDGPGFLLDGQEKDILGKKMRSDTRRARTHQRYATMEEQSETFASGTHNPISNRRRSISGGESRVYLQKFPCIYAHPRTAVRVVNSQSCAELSRADLETIKFARDLDISPAVGHPPHDITATASVQGDGVRFTDLAFLPDYLWAPCIRNHMDALQTLSYTKDSASLSLTHSRHTFDSPLDGSTSFATAHRNESTVAIPPRGRDPFDRPAWSTPERRKACLVKFYAGTTILTDWATSADPMPPSPAQGALFTPQAPASAYLSRKAIITGRSIVPFVVAEPRKHYSMRRKNKNSSAIATLVATPVAKGDISSKTVAKVDTSSTPVLKVDTSSTTIAKANTPSARVSETKNPHASVVTPAGPTTNSIQAKAQQQAPHKTRPQGLGASIFSPGSGAAKCKDKGFSKYSKKQGISSQPNRQTQHQGIRPFPPHTDVGSL